MLARETLYRLAADVPQLRAHIQAIARFPQQRLRIHYASDGSVTRSALCSFGPALVPGRSYAAATRARKPAASTKAVKKTAKAKPVARGKKKKAAPSKKAEPSKKGVKKAVAKKRAPKKTAPRKRAKKVLSTEAKQRAAITELRKKTLKEPVTYSRLTGINVYVTEVAKRAKEGENVLQTVSEASKKWKTLTPAEHEHYTSLANERTAARRAEYQTWIRSHTPDEIRVANNARHTLRRKLAGTLKSRKYPSYTAKLIDDRQSKQALTAYVCFTKARWSSNEFQGTRAPEATRAIAKEWKVLSAGEKKKYEDEAQADRTRYAREKSVTGS